MGLCRIKTLRRAGQARFVCGIPGKGATPAAVMDAACVVVGVINVRFGLCSEVPGGVLSAACTALTRRHVATVQRGPAAAAAEAGMRRWR